MSPEKPEPCQFLVIEKIRSEQNVLQLGEGGEIPAKDMLAVPTIPRCYNHLIREVRGKIEQISLDTLDGFCRGDFSKCHAYESGVKDVNTRLESLVYLVENGKTSSKVILRNRITDRYSYNKKQAPDIYADIVLTEDKDNYTISLVDFSKLEGGDIDDSDIEAPSIMINSTPMERLRKGDPCTFLVNKKTGLVDIRHDNTSNDKRLNLGFWGPLFKVVNSIIEQMKG